MQGKNLKLYFESHAIVKVAMVLVIANICIPTEVCSKTISPLSFVGRTSGRINGHLMDKIMNLAMKGEKFPPVWFSRTELLNEGGRVGFKTRIHNCKGNNINPSLIGL